MAEELMELHNVMLKKGDVTQEELQVFFSIKSKSVRDFSIGAAASSLLAWAGPAGILFNFCYLLLLIFVEFGFNLSSGTAKIGFQKLRFDTGPIFPISATRRLNPVVRISISGGVGASFGLWAFSRSFDSCIENILSLEGSRMQNELAKIVVKKYRHDPSRIRQISRHFYAEQVFDDSASDLPKLRWRYRSFFSDSAASMQRNQDTDDQHGDNDKPYDDADYQNPRNNVPGNIENKSNAGNSDSDFKGVVKPKGDSVDLCVDMMGDPLDCVFGSTSMEEEIQLSGNKSGPKSATTKGHRRSRRRHQMRQREASAVVLHA